MNPTELAELLDQARRHNPQVGVTGLLLYCNGCFMQVLEGPVDAVEALYKRIAKDPRHRSLIQLSMEPISERDFGNWSMAYAMADKAFFDDLRNARWMLAPGEKQSTGRQLLSAFWQNNTLK